MRARVGEGTSQEEVPLRASDSTFPPPIGAACLLVIVRSSLPPCSRHHPPLAVDRACHAIRIRIYRRHDHLVTPIFTFKLSFRSSCGGAHLCRWPIGASESFSVAGLSIVCESLQNQQRCTVLMESNSATVCRFRLLGTSTAAAGRCRGCGLGLPPLPTPAAALPMLEPPPADARAVCRPRGPSTVASAAGRCRRCRPRLPPAPINAAANCRPPPPLAGVRRRRGRVLLFLPAVACAPCRHCWPCATAAPEPPPLDV